MGWSFIASTYGPYTGSTSGSTLNAAATLNLAVGDLLVAIGRFYEASDFNRVITFAEDDGDNDFTMLDRLVSGARYARAGYVIIDADGANATATIRMTTSTTLQYRSFVVMQFRPDSGDTVTYEGGGGAATGSGTAIASGDVDTTGTDELVVAMAFGGGEAWSSLQIEGVNATGSQGGDSLNPGYTAGWYKIYTSAQTDLNGTATLGASGTWGINLLAFKSTAPAGGTTYNEACADGVAVDESAAPTACVFGVSAADGVGVDELTGGTAIMPSAAADGVETQDAATSLAELLAAAADSVTVTGAASSIATFLRAAADSVALQDLASMLATYLVQAADGVVVDDAASVAALGVIEVLAADGVAVDDAAAAVASLQVTCTDSVTVDDLTTATFRIVAVAADGVEVNDAVTVVATMAAAAADSVSVQDAATTLCTFLVQALDGVALQDVAVSTSGALASGRVTVTFSTKRGSVSITAKRAAVTITPKVPKLTLS